MRLSLIMILGLMVNACGSQETSTSSETKFFWGTKFSCTGNTIDLLTGNLKSVTYEYKVDTAEDAKKKWKAAVRNQYEEGSISCTEI